MKNKSRYLIANIVLALGISAPLPATSADFCTGRITDRDPRIVSKIPKPAYLQTYQDPAFGTDVTRITNAQSGGVAKTMYNTVQAWNADESRLILYHTGTGGSGHHLYNGNTYEHLRQLDIGPADLEEVFWDPKNAAYLYYIQRYPNSDPLFGHLVRYNVFTETKNSVSDLKQVCNHPSNVTSSATSGSDVQGMYGDHIGVRCNNAAINGNTTDSTFYVNVRNGQASSQITIDPTVPVASNDFGYAYNIAAAPTPSNQRVLLQDSVFDANMNFIRHLDTSLTSMQAEDGNLYPVPTPEHQTIGQLPNGHDALFSAIYSSAVNGCNGDTNQGIGSMVSYDLETGACRVIIGQSNGWGYPQSGTHVSAISAANPGWVTMSTIGYGNFNYFDAQTPAQPLFSEITLTQAKDNNPVTCRLAHARTHAKDAENTDGYRFGYFGEPHPVMSPSGTRVLFSSDWYDSGSVDTYVIDLEAQAPPPATGKIDFEDIATGSHSTINSNGFIFSPVNRDSLIIRDSNTKALQPRWNDSLIIRREDGTSFDLTSFDYRSQWPTTSGSVQIVGYKSNGTILNDSFNYNGNTDTTNKSLNWSSLTTVEIILQGTVQLDNFSMGDVDEPATGKIDFEEIATGNYPTVNSDGFLFSPVNSTSLIIRDSNTQALQPRWNDSLIISREDGANFDITSFDYRSQWPSTSGTVQIVGYKSSGTIVNDSFNYNGNTDTTRKLLNWSSLTSVKIILQGTVQLDNFNMGGADEPATGVNINFESINPATYPKITSEGIEFIPVYNSSLIIRNTDTHALQPRWGDSLRIRQISGSDFDLTSFDYRHQWPGVSGTVQVIGNQSNGNILRESFYYDGNTTTTTMLLNWTGLSNVEIVLQGTVQLDSFQIQTDPTDPTDPPDNPITFYSPATVSPEIAARVLTQSTFGATEADIDQLVTQDDLETWIDQQMALPVSRTLPYVQQNSNGSLRSTRHHIWWKNVLQGDDQLRQRMAYALSQIFVISDRDYTLGNAQYGVSHFYDMLAENAFGNYRELLEKVTLHPTMGIYLGMVRNQKANPELHIRPDENYAREVLQLFSIGLYKLNDRGEALPQGNPEPTYNQDTVENFARVFTGWNFADSSGTWVSNDLTSYDKRLNMVADYNTPDPDSYHDTTAKTLLNGAHLPSSVNSATAAEDDMQASLDNIANHPNVAPFFSRLLIQHFTSSNPSAEYVGRVAAAFNNNGHGVKGDLRTVVKAILLDEEAVEGKSVNPDFGKVKEPIMQLSQLWRAFNVQPGAGATNNEYRLYAKSSDQLSDIFGQSVLTSPSVFNFFLPDNPLSSDSDLVSPELQIMTEANIAAIHNAFHDQVYIFNNQETSGWDGASRINIDKAVRLAAQPDELIDYLDKLLLAGDLAADQKIIINNHLTTIPDNKTRAQEAIFLIIASPHYMVQK